MMKKKILVVFLLVFVFDPIHCRNLHVINFRWPNLYPESFTWDPKADHFIVGSLRHRQLTSVSDAGVASALIADDSLPENSSFLGIGLDPRLHRLLAVVHRKFPPYSAVASYDLPSFRRQFLAPLDGLIPSAVVPNDVAVDYSGNAYVTDSANDVIFKVTEQGVPTILSQSQVFKSSAVDRRFPHHACGLNGVVYNPKGYLLVTQSNTGKLYRVDADDGSARPVILNKELTGADGIAARRDGIVLVVSQHKLQFIRSEDSWSEGVVYDETTLDEKSQASAVAVGAEDRIYVLYGYVNEGLTENSVRKDFSIVELVSEEESKDEKLWIYILVGFGLVYFWFWRFQMRRLVQNMNKKTA